jgi:hypothetical protein
MSDNATQTLPNSLKIIECFGGIRPMATKLEVPVTTVQGWKKRAAIPIARKALITKAAEIHKIDLAGLLPTGTAQATQNPPEVPETPVVPEVPSRPSTPEVPQNPNAPEIPGNPEVPNIPEVPEIPITAKAPTPAPQLNRTARPAQPLDASQAAALQARSTQSLINGVVGGVSLAALIGVIGLLVLTGPEVKESKQQTQKIAELEAKLEKVTTQQGFLEKIVPKDLDKRFGDLRDQTAQVKQNVTDLAQQASVISQTVMGPNGGSIAQRIQSLEGEIGRFAALSGSSDLAGFVGKLSTMQDSLEGQEQLQSAMSELWGTVNGMQETANDADGPAVKVDEALAQSRTEGTALTETFGALENKDLKAAAMLMGLAQLRSALGRDNKSFDKDLVLLQKFVGSEDEVLNKAIVDLAPKAKHGVLTAGGLSRELRALGGDIVSSSLQGEDVSWKEKAAARFNNVLKVEKNGELITGTKTQERVEAAQYYLDQGDVESALVILNDLQGPARLTADGLIEQLKTTALADQVEEMMTGKVMQNVMGFDLSALKDSFSLEGLASGNLEGLTSGNLEGLLGPNGLDAQSVKGLMDTFENMMPQRNLVEDPVSGYKFMDGGLSMPTMPDISMDTGRVQ